MMSNFSDSDDDSSSTPNFVFDQSKSDCSDSDSDDVDDNMRQSKIIEMILKQLSILCTFMKYA